MFIRREAYPEKATNKGTDMKTYMNEKTGSLDTYECWYYDNEEGITVNAVDLGEVVEVERVDGEWVEV